LRRKRNDVVVELRKTLRDEQVLKHRNIVLDNHDEELDFISDQEMTIDNIKEGKSYKNSLITNVLLLFQYIN